LLEHGSVDHFKGALLVSETLQVINGRENAHITLTSISSRIMHPIAHHRQSFLKHFAIVTVHATVVCPSTGPWKERALGPFPVKLRCEKQHDGIQGLQERKNGFASALVCLLFPPT
jgi:hypothetical protein